MQRPDGDARRLLCAHGGAGCGGVRLHPPEHALDACAKLAQVERLGDVVVGTDFESGNAIGNAGRACHHDDADIEAFAQEAGEAQTVFTRQIHVEQHDVRQVALDRLAHRRAAVHARDFVAVSAQVFREHLTHRRVVLDDEQAAVA